MNLDKFDLERALAGEPIITRDGREVTQLTLFNVNNTSYPLYGVVNNTIFQWNTNGKIYNDIRIDDLDLFMKPKIEERFYNVYYNKVEDFFLLAGGYKFEKEAKKKGKTFENYVKTIRVTNQPD